MVGRTPTVLGVILCWGHVLCTSGQILGIGQSHVQRKKRVFQIFQEHFWGSSTPQPVSCPLQNRFHGILPWLIVFCLEDLQSFVAKLLGLQGVPKWVASSNQTWLAAYSSIYIDVFLLEIYIKTSIYRGFHCLGVPEGTCKKTHHKGLFQWEGKPFGKDQATWDRNSSTAAEGPRDSASHPQTRPVELSASRNALQQRHRLLTLGQKICWDMHPSWQVDKILLAGIWPLSI